MEKKKGKRKTARRFLALLAAACMLGMMPGVPAVSYAEEGIGEPLGTYDAGVDGQEENPEDSVLKGQTGGPAQEAGETAKEAGNQEDMEEKDAEDKRNPEEPDKKNMENEEDPEESEDQKDTGKEVTEDTGAEEKTGESGTDKEDAPDKEDPEESEKPEETPEGAQDTKGEETGAGDEGITGEETGKEGETTGEEEAAGEGEITGEGEIIGEEETADEVETEESAETDIVLLSAQTADSSTVQDDNTYTDENGVIYHYYAYDDGTAEIYGLEDCNESKWDYKVLDIPAQVGDYTVTRLTFATPSDTPTFPSVTIPGTVTYMEGSLFKRTKITELYYNAEAAETSTAGASTGVFFQARIGELHIGETVKVIPDYCFDSAKITMDELMVNAGSIGRQAFHYNKTITTLTIGEDVKEIGFEAFADIEVENINYNAVHAQSETYGQLVLGTFGNITVSDITIGDRVTVIPANLFSGIEYTADTLIFPECLQSIEAMAFYGSDIAIGELTVGENVAFLGQEAFSGGKIGILNYNAVDARQDGVTETDRYRAAFEGAAIGELQIGEKVKTLPDAFLCGASLVQDTLTLPDSITYIGSHVLSYSAGRVKIGTLEIGENVAHIGRAAFGCNTYDRVVVRTVKADVPPKSDMDIELPICSEIEIHGKSPYYDFFTTRTDKDHITLMCEDFTTTRGEEYYDAGKKSFVTPITDACTVCGYETTRNEYSGACTVIFTDYDGRELSRQHIHKGDDATAPGDPERTGWRFTGWDRSYTNVISDLTVKAEYEIRKFPVVFKDGDRILSRQEVRYGDDAEAPENPTRPEEEWGSWKFTGWSGSYANITKEEVITAQFEKVLNQYEVLFYDAEGNVISRQTVAHGENAREPEIPEKEPTAQYNFTFTGWSAATEGITGDTALYPVYDAETRSYTVKFMDGSTVLDTQTVAYGNDATAPADPTRPEEEWGSWKFTGWSGSYTQIKRDEVIRASFDKVLNQYEVLFYDAEGNVISRQTVVHGEDAKEPEIPEKEPVTQHIYIFTGWSAATENITGDTAFYPVYDTKARFYTVSFMDGSTVLDTQKVEYGGDATAPKAPTRPEEEWGSWKFIGWSGSYTNITKEEVITAQFEKVLNQYEVLFYDAEGNVISRQTVAHGENAKEPEIPEKEPTAQYNFTFTGWSAATEGITGDTAFYPVYDTETRSYTVTFRDGSTVLDTQTVAYGNDATAPADPTRPEEEWGSWKFTGWNGSYTHIAKDEAVWAVFEKVLNTYEVTFCDAEGNVIDRQTVAYGGDAAAPEAPARPKEEWGSWRFARWGGNYTNVKKDEVVTAQYQRVLNRYEVLFYDAEGKVISRQTVAHGKDAKEPEIPEKEPTAQYHYTFTGWSAATEGITGDMAFYPVYDAETRSYTVTFMDGSTVLDTQEVAYGNDATAPADPARPEEEWGSWKFTGWSGSYTHISRDEIIRAVFEKVLNEYEVIFYDADDNILSRQTVKHGMGAKVPGAPAMEPTERECYVFAGWDGDVSRITEESCFHPLYETKTRTYTVTFMNGDITHDVQEVAYGQPAAAPSAPAREEDEAYTYRFAGWDQDYSFITGDLTVQAVFEPVEKPKDEEPDGEKPKEEEKEKEKPKDKEPGGQEPGDGDGGSGTDGEPDGGGQPDTAPTGGGQENPEPVPGIPAKIVFSQGAQPQAVQEKKPAFPIPEIPEKFIQPEEKSGQTKEAAQQETELETEEPEAEKERLQIPFWLWLLLLLGAGTGILHIILLCIFDGKRTVCGTVLDRDGNAVRGIKVSLAGQEEEAMEMQTDQSGQYNFDALEKDDYRLCLCSQDATGLLLLDIHMGRCRSKKVFTVLKSNAGSVETKRSGRKYRIDITA